MEKINEDARQWFEVHLSALSLNEGDSRRITNVKKWEAPNERFYKCNIGVAWSQITKLAGTSWIVRNTRGVVEIHSRRAFSGVNSLLEAKHFGLVWAIESVASHKLHKVIFEIEAPKLVGVITRPRAWPAFRGFGVEILGALRRVEEGKVKYITREANKCAFMIARSVTNELRLQSYVAQGEPEWLRRILDEERGRI